MAREAFSFECGFDRRRLAFLLAGGVALLVFSARLIGLEGGLYWLGWIGLLVSGPLVVHIAKAGLRRGPVVVIDSEGVWDWRIGPETIPWTAIRRFHADGARIVLDVERPERFRRPTFWATGLLAGRAGRDGGAGIDITVAGLSCPPARLMRALEIGLAGRG